MTDRLKIAVVEDTPKHIDSAEKLLSDHDVKIVRTFDEATDMLKEREYDVLLTDLLYTQGEGRQQCHRHLAREQLPFGFPLALLAAKRKVPHIGILTDMDHHDSPLAYAFDFFKTGKWIKVDGQDVKEVDTLRLEDSKLRMFDTRDLPRSYVMKDDSITSVSPYGLSDEESLVYKSDQDGRFEQVKSWRAALDMLRAD